MTDPPYKITFSLRGPRYVAHEVQAAAHMAGVELDLRQVYPGGWFTRAHWLGTAVGPRSKAERFRQALERLKDG